MTLFDRQHQRNRRLAQPLPARMRPTRFEDFVGQQGFLGPGKLLRRMIDADRLTSVIFFGPPGTGKTTLAAIIAHSVSAHFEQANAAAIGVREIRDILSAARNRLETSARRTILFLDEIHRFNRAQQDVLLEDVEQGVVILIGATTENPFFTVNSPLLSRSQIFRFEPLTDRDIATLLRRALSDTEVGLGALPIRIDDDALQHLAAAADGDARRALAALEIAVLSQRDPANPDRAITIDTAVAAESIQKKLIQYDASGDQHYDVTSALIKSIRGSDPDAAIYWLARMLEGGEDPRFIARRVVIAAAEDIGNADPQGLVLAQAAAHAVAFIGPPECEIPLAQAVTYLACAPKSNAAYRAVKSARADVRDQKTIPVPKHLRDASYAGAEQLEHGTDYKYPHDFEGARVEQDYLGVDKQYYHPTDRGHEQTIRRFLEARARAGEPGNTTEPNRNRDA